MYNEIIELLPSRSLKKRIYETEYRFTEEDLLYIIYHFAKTFEQRIDMLRRFAKTASHPVAEGALMLAEYQARSFKDFCNDKDGHIYELRIKESSWEERFICSSYEAALKYIDLYYDEYGDIGIEEAENTVYVIAKRRIFTGADNEGFCEDETAKCFLGKGKILLSVEDTRPLYDDCDGDCVDCKRICSAHGYDTEFPCFTKDLDIIKCITISHDDKSVSEELGICQCDSDAPINYIYTMPFDSDTIKNHMYDDDSRLRSHGHVYAPFVEVVSIDELDEKMKGDYLAYIEYLNSTGK